MIVKYAGDILAAVNKSLCH